MSIETTEFKSAINEIHDRFDKVEKKLDCIIDNKNLSEGKLYFDNFDLMRITNLSYRALQEYRRAGKLMPTSKKGRNRYTLQEGVRFLTNVLNIKIDDIMYPDDPENMYIKIDDKHSIPLDIDIEYIDDDEPCLVIKEPIPRMPQGFAILIYFTNNPLIIDFKTTTYEQFFGRDKNNSEINRNRIITKKEAYSIIKEYGLTMVINNNNGQVWE